MKKAGSFIYVLLVACSLSFVFQHCSRKKDNAASPGAVVPGNEIAESELPKGKLVIEDDNTYRPPVNKPVSAVGGSDYHADNEEGGSAMPPTVSRTDQLKKVYKNLLVFHADDTMEVNLPKLATLILARNESLEKATLQVLEESNATDDKIKMDTTMDFGSRMKAKLISFGGSNLDNSFEIEPLGSDEQSFRNGRKQLVWQWKITPLKEGQHELKLSVQIIEKDGEAVYLPARNIPVIIFAKKKDILTKFGEFISNKYEWILTAIFLPIFIAWLTTRLRNKGSRNT